MFSGGGGGDGTGGVLQRALVVTLGKFTSGSFNHSYPEQAVVFIKQGAEVVDITELVKDLSQPFSAN